MNIYPIDKRADNFGRLPGHPHYGKEQHPKSPHECHCICFYCEAHHPENAKYRDTLLGDCLRAWAAIRGAFKRD